MGMGRSRRVTHHELSAQEEELRLRLLLPAKVRRRTNQRGASRTAAMPAKKLFAFPAEILADLAQVIESILAHHVSRIVAE